MLMYWENENFIKRWVSLRGTHTDRFFWLDNALCYGDGPATRYLVLMNPSELIPIGQREAIENMARARYGL